MKKTELMQLISTPENGATLRVNNFCALRRQTVAPWGEKVDRVWLDFTDIAGYGNFIGSFEIDARDYDGIKKTIQACIRVRLEALSEYLCKAVENGYTA